MNFVDMLLWINLGVFLIYLPVVCWLDLKYREVHPFIWVPMLAVCVPIAIYFYSVGFWYTMESFAVSVVMSTIFLFAFRGGLIEGADFLFLLWISLFWVMSPVGGYAHGLMQITFYIYLVFAGVVTMMFVYLYNATRGFIGSFTEMASNYPNGVPYMIPISVAFLMSAVFG